MPDSQMVDRMSDSVLTKLLEVESELATQEAGLLAQIEAIRQKRASLGSVMSMFATSENAANPPEQTVPAKRGRKKSQAKPQETNNATATSVIDHLIEPTAEVSEVAPEPIVEMNGAATTSAASQPPAEEKKASRGRRSTQANQSKAAPASKAKPSTRGTKTKQPSPTAQSEAPASATKAKPAAKGGRKSNNWRNYMRPEFGKAPLPEVVSSVLQRQANGILDVPTIVSTIFVQDTPKDVRNQARDRVLHILSAGVKEKKWYRGKTGQYSLSQAAAESTIDS